MNFFEELISNKVLLFSGLSWILAQLIKIITTLITEKRFRLDRIFGDGGMPSGHSATVMCLAVLTGYLRSFASIEFAVAAILAIIVMNDAAGVRREAGKQAASIKEIAEALNGIVLGKSREIKTENLKLLVGHTPFQVIMGALLGAIVATVAILTVL